MRQGYELDLESLKEMFKDKPILWDDIGFWLPPNKSSTLEEAILTGDLHFLNKYSALLSLHNILLELLGLKTPIPEAIVYVSVKIDELTKELM